MSNSPQDLYKKILGRKGERLAESYLKKQGCKILKRNFTTPFGEADLIVQDGDEVAFVEVKTRTGDRYGAPREAVGLQKRTRYMQIAKFYWKWEKDEPNARFDVAEVYEDGRVEYFKNAF
jgi:putative endonuclease